MNDLRLRVEDFLYHEAALLDEWRLEDWASLFTEDGVYLIPPTDNPEGERNDSLFLIADDHHRLVERAKRLLKKEAHVEYPHSKTCHLVSNVRVKEIKGEVIYATCKFITYRSKREILDPYVGHCDYKLVERDGELKIVEKRVVLAMDALRPQGKVSVIL
jgi:p-cumate 2,3-dioxygenase subunit beta